MNSKIINSEDELLYELAIIFNNEMYISNYISFDLYKTTENIILNQINKIN